MAGGEDQEVTGNTVADSAPAPAVVRSKETRLTGGRVIATLVFDRPLTNDELARFYRQPANGRPVPLDFFIEGKSARYECDPAEEPKWRLAFEIYFVKAFRVDGSKSRPTNPSGTKSSRETGIRNRAGFRKLHLG